MIFKVFAIAAEVWFPVGAGMGGEHVGAIWSRPALFAVEVLAVKSALPLARVHHHPVPPTDLDSVFADLPSHLLIAGHANESPSASAPAMYSPVSQLARRAPGLRSSTLAKVTHEVQRKDRVREQSSHMCRSPFSRFPKQDIPGNKAESSATSARGSVGLIVKKHCQRLARVWSTLA